MFQKPLYEYLIQGSEGKTYFDYERDLEIPEEQAKEIE
jgi:hypothetical protein